MRFLCLETLGQGELRHLEKNEESLRTNLLATSSITQANDIISCRSCSWRCHSIAYFAAGLQLWHTYNALFRLAKTKSVKGHKKTFDSNTSLNHSVMRWVFATHFFRSGAPFDMASTRSGWTRHGWWTRPHAQPTLGLQDGRAWQKVSNTSYDHRMRSHRRVGISS